jgi:hypothetical protein
MGIHELALSSRRAVAVPRLRSTAYAARLQLTGVVLVSFVLRSIAALGHQSPRYFPDEYIYSQLARSIAEGRGLEIRGAPAHFPALLEPLLSAPFWLSGDAQTAFRLTLVWHALAMSLAAIPVFLLCRRLHLSDRVSLAAGALAVTLPSLTWASYLTADAIAYPLALGALCAIVALLDQPSRRLQVFVPVLCGAATLARVQYVVLPVVFLVAAAVLERGRVPSIARRYRLTLILFASPAILVFAAGPAKILGYYSAVTDLSLGAGALLHWFTLDIVLLMIASGVVLAPGAAMGIASALLKPRTRSEAAFGLVTVLFAASLLFEAALYASNGSERFQERYLMTLPPLLAPAFALGLRRSSTAWRFVGGASAAGLLLFAARVPLSGYTIGTGKQDSPFLTGIYQVQQWTTGSTGAFIVAAVGAALAATGAAVFLRPKRGLMVGFCAMGAVMAAVSIASTSFDHAAGSRARITDLPGDKQWVDHSGVKSADVLLLPNSPRSVTPTHLFWNTALKGVMLLPDTDEPDAFPLSHVRIGADGTLLSHGKAVRRPVLVEQYLAKAAFQDAQQVRTTLMSALWRPADTVRFSWLIRRRYFDGWLSSSSSISVWPDASGRTSGTLKMRFYLPGAVQAGSVRLSAPGLRQVVHVTSGGHVTVDIPVQSGSVWTLQLRATGLRFLPDGRTVSVQSLPPVFERTPALKVPATSADRD